MNEFSIAILLAIALCAILVWLLIPRHKSSRTDHASFHPDAIGALPTARHYGYFPQVRQALSAADSQYLMETAPPHVAKQALRERRAVARRFLKGLHEDFSNLAKLGRMIAAHVSGSQPRARNRTADSEPEISNSVHAGVVAAFHRHFAAPAA